MRLIKIVLLALTTLLMTTALASADTITVAATGPTSITVGQQVGFTVTLDCECAGGAGDPSDYVIVQMVMNFNNTVLTYMPADSTPNTPADTVPPGTEDPGIIVFGDAGNARNLQLLNSTEGDTYYGSGGGPFPTLTPQNVLIFYTSKGFLGTRANSPGLLGEVVFQGASAGSSDVEIQMPAGETFMIELGDTSQLDDTDIAITAPITVTVPEPAAVTGSLAVLLTLYGLHARRRDDA